MNDPVCRVCRRPAVVVLDRDYYCAKCGLTRNREEAASEMKVTRRKRPVRKGMNL